MATLVWPLYCTQYYSDFFPFKWNWCLSRGLCMFPSRLACLHAQQGPGPLVTQFSMARPASSKPWSLIARWCRNVKRTHSQEQSLKILFWKGERKVSSADSTTTVCSLQCNYYGLHNLRRPQGVHVPLNWSDGKEKIQNTKTRYFLFAPSVTSFPIATGTLLLLSVTHCSITRVSEGNQAKCCVL